MAGSLRFLGVVTGLDPVTHLNCCGDEQMDCRIKSGNDEPGDACC